MRARSLVTSCLYPLALLGMVALGLVMPATAALPSSRAALAPATAALGFSTYLGGSDYEQVLATATDSAGNVYVAGDTYSANFPATASAFQTRYAGGVDAFVAKLDPSGTQLLYATFLGGTDYEEATAIAVDTAGSAYVTGWTSSNDFPVTAGAFQRTAKWQDAFVTKLSADGSSLVYSTRLGGADSKFSSGGSDDYGQAIAVDAAGHAFVSGDTTTKKFPVTTGAFQTTFKGLYDVFVTKLDPTGSSLLYSTYVGGSSFDYGLGMAIDPAGDAFVTGETLSSNFPTVSPFQPTLHGFSDISVSKLDPTGSRLVYSSYLGGSGVEGEVLLGASIAMNRAGEALLTGTTQSSDFPVTAGAFQPRFGGGRYDAFVAKVSASGSVLRYASYLGGGGEDEGIHVAAGSDGTASVVGYTASTNFPVVSPLQPAFGGGATDGYMASVNPKGTALIFSSYWGGRGDDQAWGVATTPSGGVAVAGYTDSPDFTTTPGVVQPSFGGLDDGFVTTISR